MGSPDHIATAPFDPAVCHRTFGRRKPNIAYAASDFVDYVLMNAIVVALAAWVFGLPHPLTIVSAILAFFMIVAFPIRHGLRLAFPVILRRPQEIVFSFVYKILNVRTPLLVAACLALSEQLFMHLTPGLPHASSVMRTAGLTAFYVSFAVVTLFRTRSLLDHLAKRELVREVLSRYSIWKKAVASTSPTFEIAHAYVSGVLSHLAMVAPWYLALTRLEHSVIFLPFGLVASVLVYRAFFFRREFREWESRKRKSAKAAVPFDEPRPEMLGTVASWFYRDHWVGHNSELEFVYLHGSHHDSIPVGLLATGEHGHLEGFLRYCFGYPTFFLSPIWPLFEITVLLILNIGTHQYVPGIFPYCFWHSRGNVHFLHHFGRLVPYGVTTTGRPEIDIALNGYDPDNAGRKTWQSLVDEYEGDIRSKMPGRMFPPLRVYK